MPTARRQDLEALWGARLKDAEENVRSARAACKEGLAMQAHIPFPDGSSAYRRALRDEVLTIREYMRVLRIFTSLKIDGIMPPED